MIASELKSKYLKHPKLALLSQFTNEPRSHTRLKGVVGSGTSIIASAWMEKNALPALYILPDKEEAAYFLNDLESLNAEKKFFFFPRSARVPYEPEQTENANVAMRAEVLNEIQRLASGKHSSDRIGVHQPAIHIITYAEAIAEKVVTQRELASATFEISVGNSLDHDFVDEWMHLYGFEKVDYVFQPGHYAIRGGIIDIFSYSFEHPYRIELFGNEVESIRKFEPATQLSVAKMTRATIVPNVTEHKTEESRVSLLEFLPEETTVWIKDTDLLLNRTEMEWEKAQKQFDKLSGLMNHLPPTELYVQKQDLFSQLEARRSVEFGLAIKFVTGETVTFEMEPQPAFNKNFDLLGINLANNAKNGYTNIVAAGQPKQIERLNQIFEDKDHAVNFYPLTIELSEGFVDKENKILVYTDHQIFERYHRFRLKDGFSKAKEAITLKEIMALQPGDYVVHIDHGIGQFGGLQKIDVNGKEQEAIRLMYKGGDILYVSIHSLHRISKFVGKEGTQPTLDRLGSNAWQTLKRKTKTKVKLIAFDLIKLYAKRKATKGFAYSPDTYLQTELEASFIYEDTPDQLKSTHAVKEDMEASAPMDRLICGDVGFGKTEIAIRAAFKAVTDNKQVAVLAPTTILTLQHFKSFSSRLKNFPCTVDYLNRFKSQKKITETLKKLEQGKIDIIIGTHALAGNKVKFKDLGLLIIDEEQKFGVGVKDKLKTLRANVDTLTLTATPIPRTLQFSMMGARDLSLVQTPPPNRFPIQTELHTFNEAVIRDAISYEIQRGGQVFFVHNRVSNLAEVAGMIQRLCPDVRIAIGHGQLTGEQLEDVMSRFVEGEADVLVSTAIVESGLDIPNANTMIVNDAHHFGMSDLHQLRGRVGRTNKKAFCYLLTPPLQFVTSDARKRLQAIEQFSDLGSGLHIAMRDLDIRGAGNLLGAEQSGFINDIGFETYQKILNEALDELKQEHFTQLYEEEMHKSQKYVKETVLETDFEILIPDEYVSSISERIALYKELDDIETDEALQKFCTDLVDRFGPIPKSTLALIETMKLRWLARETGMEKLVLKSGKLIGYFVSKENSPYYQSEKFTRVLEFVKLNPVAGRMYQKDNSLRISFNHILSLEKAVEVLRAISTATVIQN
ncbi:MAG: transcription-repair coupling factor [Flavobacteriales bacterium]|nr:transcription-repair coupling factor [Flavobacteriales bacterium]